MSKRLLNKKSCLAAKAELATGNKKRAAAAPGVSSQVLSRLKQAAAASRTSRSSSLPNHGEEDDSDISDAVSSILRGTDDTDASSALSPAGSDDGLLGNKILNIWFSSNAGNCKTEWWKQVSRERKKKYIFKNTEVRRITKLMRMCADKFGTESTLDLFGKMGRDTGIKEFNALIGLCIDKAKSCNDEDTSVAQIHKAYRLFLSMKERGFQIEEQSFGPFLLYLVEMGMTQEFEMFSEFFKNANPQSYSRIAYYEMLLWIRVEDEDKIQELRDSVDFSDGGYNLAESYVLAFAESDRKMDLVSMLEVLDIMKVSKPRYISQIFKSLGRLKLENFAEKFLLKVSLIESAVGDISSFIYDYASNVPDFLVEDIVSAFNTLHEKFKVTPSLAAYDKIIVVCCNLSKTSIALDIADRMCQFYPNVPIESFHPIIQACDQGYEFDMVHPIYSVIRRHSLKPNTETFKSLMSLCMKMKDYEGAYNLLTDAEEIGALSTVILYNAIMVGYLREKNNNGALMVLKQMQNADVKPDSETYSYLISNCDSEEDISKYHDELRKAGVHITKHIYMARINAYSRLGNFDMAKQVLLDHEIPPKHLNEIRSAFVAALASNGQISAGLELYEEIKQSGCCLEPKAVKTLIEHTRTEGELDRLCQLLEGLCGSSSWFDGCSRVILYCVQYNHADAAINLLKQLKEKNEMSTYMVLDQVFCQVCYNEPVNLDIGMELLHAVKEELGLHISRTSLDFLLSACVKAKDSHCAQLIWTEYKSAGLPYNVLTYLRIYQALLSSGEHKAAKKMLKRIPKADPHVRDVIKFCNRRYSWNAPSPC